VFFASERLVKQEKTILLTYLIQLRTLYTGISLRLDFLERFHKIKIFLNSVYRYLINRERQTKVIMLQ
jgi:hypothetical protein